MSLRALKAFGLTLLGGWLATACANGDFAGTSGKAKKDAAKDDGGADDPVDEDDGEDAADAGDSDEVLDGGALDTEDGEDDGGGDLDEKSAEVGTLIVDGEEIKIKGDCKVLHFAYKAKGGYVPVLADTPANLTIRYLSTDEALTAADMKGVKLIAVSDSDKGEEAPPVTVFDAADLALFKKAYESGTDFFFGFDNGAHAQYDAGLLSRTAIRGIDSKVGLEDAYGGTVPAQVVSPDATKFPFLKGITYDFTTSGLNTPGFFTTLVAPTECVITVGGKCAVAYTPEKSGHGFSYMSGNANIGNDLLFGRMIGKSCGG